MFQRRPVRVIGFVVKHALYAVWVSTMILTPLFGFWLASSLAAYSNASPWFALLVGLLLFPLVPVGWDLFYVWRRRGVPPAKQILTRLDRLVLRTLLVNGLFLGVMIWRAPETAFRALAVRGDWIVDGHHGPVASSVRGFLLGLADRFEQHWHDRTSDEYGTSDRPPEDVAEDERPTPVKPGDPTPGWPMENEPEAHVTGMPESEQTSVDAVGRYLAARITDERRLAKALHDYVVLRLRYDHATAELRGEERYTKRPSQQAVDVFVARTAVCEGYARLFAALATAAGLEAKYVTGYIRDSERRVDAEGTDDAVKSALEGYLHAWNAVRIDGRWELVDTTWDDPTSKTGDDNYETTYLFTPPVLFRYDHLPEEPAWQLVAVPLSAGEFARQPLMTPRSGKLGVVLESPTRSQVTIDGGEIEIVFDNPYGADLLATVGDAERCSVEAEGTKRVITCTVPTGEHAVRIFGKPASARANSYPYIGTVLVNRR